MKKQSKYKHKSVRIGFFSVLLLSSFFLNEPSFALASLISITVHELGHVIAAQWLQISFCEFNLSIFGAGLRPDISLFSYKEEIFICACGPTANFFTFLITFPISVIISNTFLLYVSLSSLTLGALNLMPIKDMDGGRILHSLLCLHISPKIAEKSINVISFISIFLLWVCSVYLLLVTATGLSSFIFSASIFSKMFLTDYIR